MTFPPFTGIRNIRDFARAAVENCITCYLYKDIAFRRILLESDFATWKSIGQCLQKNVITSNDTEAAFIKAPPNKAFKTSRTFLKPYEEMYIISENSFYNSTYAFSISKEFSLQSPK